MPKRVQQFITAPQRNPRKPICNPSGSASWLNCICFKRFSCARSNESWTWGFWEIHQNSWSCGREENELHSINLCVTPRAELFTVCPISCLSDCKTQTLCSWLKTSQPNASGFPMHLGRLGDKGLRQEVLDNSTQSMEMKLKDAKGSNLIQSRSGKRSNWIWPRKLR